MLSEAVTIIKSSFIHLLQKVHKLELINNGLDVMNKAVSTIESEITLLSKSIAIKTRLL